MWLRVPGLRQCLRIAILSKEFKVKWTLNMEEDFIEIRLGAATGVVNYMAFVWANPSDDFELLIDVDVIVVGFKEKPFVGDFFITKYSECVINSNGLAWGCLS
ncbi:putative cytochrome b561, DM13 and DOMON domain-containing [Sesbania bispinosa]|nr:putative cytochrome b561, DM13 and DOMON domain-containing [Sesbania bispinosa]